jgi:peptidoglycan/LPS O-acetylase OafA/YrhL
MEWLAAAIVICTVLYLIDKNQKWGTFFLLMLGCIGILAAWGLVYAIDYYTHSGVLRTAAFLLVCAVCLVLEVAVNRRKPREDKNIKSFQ